MKLWFPRGLLVAGMFALFLAGCARSQGKVVENHISLSSPSPSFSPLFSQQEEAARFVVASLLQKLRSTGEPLDEHTFAVGYTPSVPQSFVKDISRELAKVGCHQVVGDWWLKLVAEAQDRFQLSDYQPQPRERLIPADILVAVDREDPSPKTARLRVSLLTLKAIGSADAGEVLPGCSVVLYLRKSKPSILVSGFGFCNKSLPREKWRYSALKAAELDAKAKVTELIHGINVVHKEKNKGGELKEETTSTLASGKIAGVKKVNQRFDPYSCEAKVVFEYYLAP